MAKIYFCNDGVSELQPSTLNIIRAFPNTWNVLLNFRPVGQLKDREVDALIVTEAALHVVEFKYRSQPLDIKTESAWLDEYGNRITNERNESPKEQVTKTCDAFTKWLEAHPKLRHLKRAALAWVVLEKYNSANSFDGRPMRADRYELVGHVPVLNGPERLYQHILQQEKYKRGQLPVSGISPTEDVPILLKELGAQHLDSLTVRGMVSSLEDGRGLHDIQLRVSSLENKKSPLAYETEVVTDLSGSFEVTGLPIGGYRIELKDTGSWRVIPGTDRFSTASVSITSLYLSNSRLNDEQVQALLEQRLQTFKSELNDVQELVLESQEALEHKLAQTTERLANAEALGNSNALELEKLRSELAAVQRQSRLKNALGETDLQVVAREALAPLREELAVIKQAAAQALLTAQEAHQNSSRAVAVADDALAAAREAATQAEQSTAVQQQRLQLEVVRADEMREEKVELATKRSKFVQAMYASVVVGSAGGIVSMQPLPFADNLIITPMQVGLIIWIGGIYGRSISSGMASKVIAAAGFGLFAQHATLLLYKFIPGLTFGLGPITVIGFTVLLGAMVCMYYEVGRFPSDREKGVLLGRIIGLMGDKETQQQFKELGQGVVAEVKLRNYRIKPSDMQDILDNVGDQGKNIGERFANALKLDKLRPDRE
jgi:uncharacterized protein (DUF697 family)